MATHPTNLVVVAHPDDEAIFFAGLIMGLRSKPWHLICVTDGNADGRGKERHLELAESCRILGIKSFEQWGYRDIYDERLPVKELTERLQTCEIKFNQIYTHGILGEYGHPHHQDVSFAVHKSFAKTRPVWSVAYNCRPAKVAKLSLKQFIKKKNLLVETYAKETRKFIQLLPVTAVEEFVRLDLREINEIYQAILDNRAPNPRLLKVYKGWEKILPLTPYWSSRRLF